MPTRATAVGPRAAAAIAHPACPTPGPYWRHARPGGHTMYVDASTLLQLLALGCALAAAGSVRPWRMLQGGSGQALATPLLACATVLPWLWAWPTLGDLPIALQWSAAPLVVLLVGWPLAMPLFVLAGLSTLVSAGADWTQAVSLTFWSGLLPGTAALGLGHLVRKAFGTHPVAYLLGRAFLVPVVALMPTTMAFALLGDGVVGIDLQMHSIAALLLAVGEASWTCGVVTLLVAYRPQWLATWSDRLYLAPPVVAPARTHADHR